MDFPLSSIRWFLSALKNGTLTSEPCQGVHAGMDILNWSANLACPRAVGGLPVDAEQKAVLRELVSTLEVHDRAAMGLFGEGAAAQLLKALLPLLLSALSKLV